jgi:N-acetylneuraminate lyase/4-hydroxy-tetrahydrodipicolinate synthase
MTDQEKIKGIIPPLTTPFTKDGQVYESGLRELIEFQVQAGTHGVFICGTYGSGPIMTVAQRKQVAEIVVDQNKGRLAVIAHVGTASTEQSVELAQHAERIGCDLVSAISPYYHRHDERTVVHFFDTLVKSVDLPVWVYNNPKCSGVTITPSFLAHLADVGVQGIKDSGFSFIELTHFLLALQDKPDFRFVAGTEALALPAWQIGARGSVSGLANCIPEIMVELWNLYQAGDFDRGYRLQLKVNRARQVLHIPSSTNAACYAVLHERGIDAGYPKAPILPVQEEKRVAMIAAFEEMGLI